MSETVKVKTVDLFKALKKELSMRWVYFPIIFVLVARLESLEILTASAKTSTRARFEICNLVDVRLQYHDVKKILLRRRSKMTEQQYEKV